MNAFDLELPQTVPSSFDWELQRARDRARVQQTLAAEEGALTPRRTGSIPVEELVAQALVEMKQRRESGVIGFPTGVTEFDGKAAPVFQPGRLIGVAGNTKGGKTTLLAQWATHWAALGIPVLCFFLEDDPIDLMYRMLANIGSGDVGQLRSGFLGADGEKRDIPADLDTAAEALSRLPMRLTSRALNIEQLGTETLAWKQHEWPSGATTGVVVVDQLSHIIPDDPRLFRQRWPGFTPPPSADNTAALMEWQARTLQRIARMVNVLVVVAMQRNEKDADHEVPTVHSVRGSRGIGHTVDALVIPWRPSRLPNPDRGPGEPDTIPNDLDRMWLVVPVARGVNGGFRVEVAWHGAHQRVGDLNSVTGDAWQRPERISAKALDSIRSLALLRERWNQHVDAVQVHANAVLAQAEGEAVPPAPEAPAQLTAVGQPDAHWQLTRRQAELLPGPQVPDTPIGPGGFPSGFGGTIHTARPDLFT